jgi:hypothetical protein
MSVRTLSDAHVGTSKTELVAQRHHSQTVVRFFRHHRWMLAARHATCWRVPWSHTCNRARNLFRAHRWLHALAAARLARLYPSHPPDDWAEFSCIHRYEGATNANTGNGYYGGLQEDLGFQRTYGAEFLARWGTADRWPIWAQVTAARRARDGYGGYGARGYTPWPNTARACGLL